MSAQAQPMRRPGASRAPPDVSRAESTPGILGRMSDLDWSWQQMWDAAYPPDEPEDLPAWPDEPESEPLGPADTESAANSLTCSDASPRDRLGTALPPPSQPDLAQAIHPTPQP